MCLQPTLFVERNAASGIRNKCSFLVRNRNTRRGIYLSDKHFGMIPGKRSSSERARTLLPPYSMYRVVIFSDKCRREVTDDNCHRQLGPCFRFFVGLVSDRVRPLVHRVFKKRSENTVFSSSCMPSSSLRENT